MPYTAATKLPVLNFFQWSTPSAPNPRLASPIDSDDTTLTFTSPPLDRLGSVITGNFLIGVTNSDSYTETIYVPPAGMSVDGLTATGCVRGIRPTGIDYTTGDASFAASHNQDSPVICNVTAVYELLLQGAIQGTIATNGLGLILGDETNGNATISQKDVASTKGFLRKNPTTAKVQYSNDGAVWVNIDSVSASDLVAVSAADTTPSYLATKVVAGDGLDESITTPGGDERLQLDVDVTDFIDTSYGLTENTNNIRINLGADPGLEFVAGALEAKVDPAGGISKGAAGLALTNSDSLSITAGEAIDGSVTPKAAFISRGVTTADAFPLQVQETENNAGTITQGVNYTSQTFTTGTYQTKLKSIDLLLIKTGAPSGNIAVDIYAVDGSSKPTGASLGTKTLVASTPPTTYMQWVNFAFASEITVTPATQYAIRMTVVSGGAGDYVKWVYGSGNTYSGGQAWTSNDAGATWSSFANDYSFRAWGYEAQTAGRLYMSDSDEPFRGMVDGFVTTNTAAAGTATLVYRGKQASFAGLTAGADYYVSSTIGGIATSGGLRVGKAISTTEIEIDFSEGFVEKAVATSPALSQAATTVEEYLAIFQCGFKPSIVELEIILSNVGNPSTNGKTLVFKGRYTSSLSGAYVALQNSTAAADAGALLSAASSLAVTDAGGVITTTAGTFTLTNTGLTFKISMNDVASSTSAAGSAQAVFYR